MCSVTNSTPRNDQLRFSAYSFWAGPGKGPRWWTPDRENTSKGRTIEPVTISSVLPPRQQRALGGFDVSPEPGVYELDVWLLKGETIGFDAARLFRSRPPAWHNPLATKEGCPGVAMRWMEVEGPLFDEWPAAGHHALFGDLPIRSGPDRCRSCSAGASSTAGGARTNACRVSMRSNPFGR